MYRIWQLALALSVLVSPARLVAALPAGFASTTVNQVQTRTVNSEPYNIKLDSASSEGVVAIVPPAPNFDTDVLAPLRAKQATEAAAARARARVGRHAARATAKVALVAASPRVSAAASDEALAKLRSCESGVYTRNSGNGYYGAYQYAIGSWGNFGGYARADLAPAEIQDQKVRIDVAAHGWGAWPTCARKMGLM
jgi:hypothetical protein